MRPTLPAAGFFFRAAIAHLAILRGSTVAAWFQRSDLAEAFAGLIPRRHGGRNSDRSAKGGSGKGSGAKTNTGSDTQPNAGTGSQPNTPGGETPPMSGADSKPAPPPETPAGAPATRPTTGI